MPYQKKNSPKVERDVEALKKRISQLGTDVDKVMKSVKKSYGKLDAKTKRKMATGLAGLGVILAATRAYKKHKAKKRF